jgi:hypothetical protein
MSARGRIWGGLVGVSLLALSVVRADAATTGYSGVVLSVDQSAGKIVVGDMGPRLKSGKSEIAKRIVHVTPSTAYVLVKRTAGAAPGGWVGGYVETSLTGTDVKPGEWVTVSIEGDTQRRTAVKVTVVDTSEP